MAAAPWKPVSQGRDVRADLYFARLGVQIAIDLEFDGAGHLSEARSRIRNESGI